MDAGITPASAAGDQIKRERSEPPIRPSAASIVRPCRAKLYRRFRLLIAKGTTVLVERSSRTLEVECKVGLPDQPFEKSAGWCDDSSNRLR